jgi:hypothetical protein
MQEEVGAVCAILIGLTQRTLGGRNKIPRPFAKRGISTAIAAVLLLLVMTFGVSCVDDTKSIEDTVSGFVAAYQGQEYSKCIDYMSKRMRTSTGDQVLINRMQVARLFSGNSSVKSIGTPSIANGRATVWVDMVGLLNITNTVQLSLVKEGGRWMIDGY